MIWPLMWLNVSVTTLNATFQLLVLYRLDPIEQYPRVKFLIFLHFILRNKIKNKKNGK